MAGSVQVNDRRVDKPGHRVVDEDRIEVHGETPRYASRGGLKLEAALEGYRLDVAGLVCLDVGASTGGFTDCLLQHGAARVYAVDVGYGQMAWTLRQDTRVVVIERANIRHLPPDAVAEAVDLITIDASFISLRIVVPAALKFLKGGRGRVLALIKPQFEVGKGQVGKGGVVTDPLQHALVLNELGRFFTGLGLTCSTPLPSPILGPKGNREFFVLMEAGRTRV